MLSAYVKLQYTYTKQNYLCCARIVDIFTHSKLRIAGFGIGNIRSSNIRVVSVIWRVLLGVFDLPIFRSFDEFDLPLRADIIYPPLAIVVVVDGNHVRWNCSGSVTHGEGLL